MKKVMYLLLASMVIVSCGIPVQEEDVSTFKAYGNYSCMITSSTGESFCMDVNLYRDTKINLEEDCNKNKSETMNAVFRYSKCDRQGSLSSGFCTVNDNLGTVDVYFYNYPAEVAQLACGSTEINGFWVGSSSGMRANKSAPTKSSKNNMSLSDLIQKLKKPLE